MVLPSGKEVQEHMEVARGNSYSIQKVDMRPEGLQQLPWKMNTELAADLFNSIFN